MQQPVAIAVAAAYAATASYLDLKRRIIPDWLTFGGACAGIAAAIYGFSANPGTIAAYSAMLVFSAAIAFALFKAGAWAGGDLKLFVALCAILGAAGRLEMATPAELFALSLAFFLAWTIAKSAPVLWEKRREAAIIAASLAKKSAAGAAVAAFFAALSGGNYYAAIIATTLLLAFPLPLFAAVAALTAAAFLDFGLAAAAFAICFGFGWATAFAIEVAVKIILPSLVTRVKIGEVREGMVPAKTVMEFHGKLVLFEPRLDIPRLLSAAKKGVGGAMAAAGILPPAGAKIIADASRAGGLDSVEVGRLKRLKKLRWLETRKTSAFAPALCAGFIAMFAGLV